MGDYLPWPKAVHRAGSRARRIVVWLVMALPRRSRVRFELLMWLRPYPQDSGRTTDG